MNNAQEWIDQFDLEWNNIMSDMAPNLDDYEKSRFLTQAQEQVVIGLYDGSLGDGFEGKELTRRQLANLLVEVRINATDFISISPKILNFSEFDVSLPTDLLVIVNERATITHPNCCNQPKEVNVVPTKYDELNKVLNNPFRRPNSNKVLRLDKTTNDIRLLTPYQLHSYVCEYLRKPVPIILMDLGQYQIDGIQGPSDCELDSSLHRTILTQAVQLAAVAWMSNNSNKNK